MKPSFIWYFTPLIFGIIESDINSYVRILACLFIGIIHIQHDFIVESYRKQTVEDTLSEQQLKKNIYKKEHEMQEEMKKGLLQAENQLLEERAQLSQTLHDKLGHNINGSVYQLEAVKVLMEKEKKKRGYCYLCINMLLVIRAYFLLDSRITIQPAINLRSEAYQTA